MPSATLPSLAIIAGTFLSGASLSTCWFSLHILLTTLAPETLHATLHTFDLLQSRADPIFPLTAVATSLLHWTHAYRMYSGGSEGWQGFAWAGAASFCLIPYSIAIVFPTVERIEGVQKKVEKSRLDGEGRGGEVEVEEVREVLRRWNGQHVVRGLMPLVGAVIGMRALLGELGA